jgi:hypothetical protein
LSEDDDDDFIDKGPSLSPVEVVIIVRERCRYRSTFCGLLGFRNRFPGSEDENEDEHDDKVDKDGELLLDVALRRGVACCMICRFDFDDDDDEAPKVGEGHTARRPLLMMFSLLKATATLALLLVDRINVVIVMAITNRQKL